MVKAGFRTCWNSCTSQAVRRFTSSPASASGHNRWSKIRHDKAKVDTSVHKQRAILAHEIYRASKENGPDVRFNPQLSTAVAAAKKQGFPKASIEIAIARGQGKSLSGAPLTTFVLEAVVPPSVALIIECETESKLRTLNELKYLVKDFGGSVTSSSHLFERRGKVVLENSQGLGEQEIFDAAIEAGALDMKMESDGNVVVFTEPPQTVAAGSTVSQALDMKILASDILWVPKDDYMVDVEEPEKLQGFLDRLQEESSVQEIYVNAK